ncbi:MAG: type II toxin-antitoxin system VapB family antitoxin [Crocosphaera sp.]|nr:type II toxin-antitoxin system VapB family antitoxin [Crocosphaera sp.]
MSIHIEDSEVNHLIQQLATLTGESTTEVVLLSLKERLDRLKKQSSAESLAKELDEIALRCSSLPVKDSRSIAEILNYDAQGLLIST